jgi:uncharacterized protein involved in tolerance to divalent cations
MSFSCKNGSSGSSRPREDQSILEFYLICGQHPYEVPGISARPIIAGNPEYLRWIRDETDGTNG